MTAWICDRLGHGALVNGADIGACLCGATVKLYVAGTMSDETATFIVPPEPEIDRRAVLSIAADPYAFAVRH